VLTLNRIPRQRIDAYAIEHPVPEPPTKQVRVLGGVYDTVTDPDDPQYQVALARYNLGMARSQFELLAEAVEIQGPMSWRSDPRCAELESLGVEVQTVTDYLLHVALTDERDLVAVMETLLYLSTVTERGIQEAERSFGIEWRGVPLHNHANPPALLRTTVLYQAREAAAHYHYPWLAFCALTGPEQSAVVAQYRCSLKVQWLAAEYERQKSETKRKKGRK
jgi:hypothetical protein